jgi:glucan phosphorylase
LEDEMADGSVGEAQEKAQEVAGEAQEKARDAAGKAQEGLRQQADQRSTQAGERVADTAQDLRSVGEELRKQGKDTPAKLADRAADQTERVSSYLQEKGPDEMLHDVEDFGRQRPWAVLTGGLALGVVAARFLKASSRSRYQQRNGAGPAQVPQRNVPPPVHRSAVEPVATPPPPTATPSPTTTPVTPTPSASPAP